MLFNTSPSLCNFLFDSDLGIFYAENINLRVNIRVLYKASHVLDFKTLLKPICPSFTFTSVMLTLFGLVLLKLKLQGVLKKQKNAARIILHADRFDHWRPILKETKAFNVYQINKFKL